MRGKASIFEYDHVIYTLYTSWIEVGLQQQSSSHDVVAVLMLSIAIFVDRLALIQNSGVHQAST